MNSFPLRETQRLLVTYPCTHVVGLSGPKFKVVGTTLRNPSKELEKLEIKRGGWKVPTTVLGYSVLPSKTEPKLWVPRSTERGVGREVKETKIRLESETVRLGRPGFRRVTQTLFRRDTGCREVRDGTWSPTKNNTNFVIIVKSPNGNDCEVPPLTQCKKKFNTCTWDFDSM